jgi:4-hydroxyphenylpyruvate dioxygenase-like putative hemolysin
MLGTYCKSEQELRLNMKGSLKIENHRMKYVELWWRGLLCFVINAFDASFFNGNVEIKEESYCGALRRRKMTLTTTSLVF